MPPILSTDVLILSGHDAGTVVAVPPDRSYFEIPVTFADSKLCGNNPYDIHTIGMTGMVELPTVPLDRFIEYGVEWLDWLPKKLVRWRSCPVRVEYRIAGMAGLPNPLQTGIGLADLLGKHRHMAPFTAEILVNTQPDRQILTGWHTLPIVRQRIMQLTCSPYLNQFLRWSPNALGLALGSAMRARDRIEIYLGTQRLAEPPLIVKGL